MNAAHLVYEFPSLSETFVLNQITGLVELGCDVRIFADSPDSKAAESVVSSALMSRVKYFGLPLKTLRESMGRVRSRIPAVPEEEPHPTRRIGDARSATLRLRFEARAFEGCGRFDIVHAHFGPNGVRAVRLRRMGILPGPIITSFYGYDVTRHWSRAGYHELFAEGDQFIAISEHMKDTLISMGAPADRVRIHRLAIDVGRFDVLPERGSPRLEIISIARLVPKKGIEFGVRAVAVLRRMGVDCRYTVVGHGPLRSSLQALTAELGISDSVHFAGPQSPQAIPGLLARADVLLAPSVTALDGDTEGTPVAILEAHGSGIPVVTTEHSGIPEVVKSGVSGFLVPESDSGALAERLAELAADPGLRQRMGAAGRARVRERHDRAFLNAELLEIYRAVLQRAPPRA